MKKGMSVSVENELFSPVAALLVGQANKVASLGLSLNKGKSGAISFHMNPSIAKEAYVLKVASKKIEIEASTGAGAFYALQTLMQLMPPAMSGDVANEHPSAFRIARLKMSRGLDTVDSCSM